MPQMVESAAWAYWYHKARKKIQHPFLVLAPHLAPYYQLNEHILVEEDISIQHIIEED